ncbi:hypothetical protein BDW75DRAFT_212854 [Aspergillus navahoensis]
MQSTRVIRVDCLAAFLIVFTVDSASVAICCCNSFPIDHLSPSPLGHCCSRVKISHLSQGYRV